MAMKPADTLDPQGPEAFLEKDTTSTPPSDKAQPTLTKLINVENHITNSNTTTTPTIHDPLLRLPVNPLLPPITTATSTSDPSILQHYMTTVATVSAHATLKDPLTIYFNIEKSNNTLTASPPPTEDILLPVIYNSNLGRLHPLVHTETSILVECSSFAAVAVWTPASHVPVRPPPSFYTSLRSEGRVAFASFLRQIEDAREKYLYPVSERFWHLSMMARDPRREYVGGAVRAVLEPFLKMAEREGVPAWLEAGSERARDVYGHFGFRTVSLVSVAGIDTWCMIKP